MPPVGEKSQTKMSNAVPIFLTSTLETSALSKSITKIKDRRSNSLSSTENILNTNYSKILTKNVVFFIRGISNKGTVIEDLKEL